MGEPWGVYVRSRSYATPVATAYTAWWKASIAECDRGDCNFVGEVAVDEVGRWVLGLAFIGLAVTLGITAARRWVRSPNPEDDPGSSFPDFR